MIRMASSEILEDAGFPASEAVDVEQALHILEKHGSMIDLLFTDAQMPPSERDGFELARECAQGWPNIHILVASGVVRPAPDDLPEGAIFINKPFSAQIVHDRLKEMLPETKHPEPLRKSIIMKVAYFLNSHRTTARA